MSPCAVAFPVVHGDIECDVTCQACRENSRNRAWVQASSALSDSAHWSEDEAAPSFLQSNVLGFHLSVTPHSL